MTMKCNNQCSDPAENGFVWPTSMGVQVANLCGACGSEMWAKFQHTEAMLSCTISEPLSEAEKTAIRELADNLAANAEAERRGPPDSEL